MATWMGREALAGDVRSTGSKGRGSHHADYADYGGRTGEKVLGKVAEGVLNGLTYLYRQKIIHRGRLALRCFPWRLR